MHYLLYNGSTGGLGRFMGPLLKAKDIPHSALMARLEERSSLLSEFKNINVPPGTIISLVHMAALVPVAACEKEPERAFKTNVQDTLSLVSLFSEWALSKSCRPRIFYVSTGHVYDKSVAGEKIKETDATRPISVYAKTKREAETKLLEFSGRHSLPLFIGRVFGLLSIHQPAHYVLPALIERAKKGDLKDIPGLSYTRDYLDARDVCRIIAVLCGEDWAGPLFPKDRVLNICSGVPVQIRDLALIIFKILKEGESMDAVPISEAPGRPTDVPWIVGDPSRLKSILKGPLQEIPLEQTIKEAVYQIENKR